MGFINRFGRIVFLFAVLSLVATVTAATGTIQISVHPGGGTVCLDTVCKDNPAATDGVGTITFENVETDSYHMLNVYGTKGCKAYLGQVYLDSSGKTLTRDIILETLPQQTVEPGTVNLDITPDGGKACIDRMCEHSSGDGTGSWSVQFTDVSANTNHTITIARDGNETYTTEILLVPDQTVSKSVILEPLLPGSTPHPTPAPLSPPTPEPTQAGLPGWIAFLATGTCGLVFVLRNHGQN